MTSTIRLDDTHAFVSVVAAGSFTEAGRRLGVPKSTLSRQVARLEERLGARLLQRTTRRLSLTETGHAYYDQCRRAIEDIEAAERRVQDATQEARGVLKVTCPFDFARDHLSKWIAEFEERYPEVVMVLVISQRRVDLLAEGVDVALRGGVLDSSEFVAKKLAGSLVQLCASPKYLDRHGRPRSPSELRDHAGVLMGRGVTDPPWRFQGPGGLVPIEPRPVFVANEWGVLHRVLLDGLGIGPMLSTRVRADLDAKRLEVVLPDYTVDDGGLYAVYPSRHHLTPKVRVFVDFLQKKVSDAWL